MAITPTHLAADGTLAFGRMRLITAVDATKKPAIRLGRLRALLSGDDPKVCIVRGEGIGDVLMTLPAVHAIKRMFQNVKITYATNTKYLSGALPKILEGNTDIDEVIERNNLKEINYDVVINLHCPAIYYEKRDNPPLNRIDIFASHAGAKIINPVPYYLLRREEEEEGKKVLGPRQIDQKIILVHVNASSERRSIDPRKIWEVLEFLYSIHNIKSAILLHGTDHTHSELWKTLPGCLILQDRDIRQIGGIMVHCDLVICPDSSILHLAGALGVPTVALFGPTDPRARINYYKNVVAIWKVENNPICPCWYEACPIGEICWKYMTKTDIVDTCLAQLAITTKVDIEALLSKENV